MTNEGLSLTQTADSYNDTYCQRQEVIETEIIKEGKGTCGKPDVGHDIAHHHTKTANNLQDPTTLAIYREAENLSYSIAYAGSQQKAKEKETHNLPQPPPGDTDDDRQSQPHPKSLEVLPRRDFVGR